MSIDDYIEAIEEMLACNEKITLQTVRAKMGRGSYTTISEAIKIVLNRGLVPAEVGGPMPEELTEEAQRLWKSACKLASEAVSSERLALHSARVEMQDSQRELMNLADTLTKQIEELTTQLETVGLERDAAESRAREAEAAAKVTKQMLKDLGIKTLETSKANKSRELAEEVVS